MCTYKPTGQLNLEELEELLAHCERVKISPFQLMAFGIMKDELYNNAEFARENGDEETPKASDTLSDMDDRTRRELGREIYTQATYLAKKFDV